MSDREYRDMIIPIPEPWGDNRICNEHCPFETSCQYGSGCFLNLGIETQVLDTFLLEDRMRYEGKFFKPKYKKRNKPGPGCPWGIK
jgi:hypothetical protein